MSQIVHVVSILDVIMSFGESVFQSRDVRGAVCSGDLELDKRARGVSFCAGGSRVLIAEDLVIVLLILEDADCGKDHNLRWSPEVAKRSVDCFCVDGGSQRILVTGYEQVASATLEYSRP